MSLKPRGIFNNYALHAFMVCDPKRLEPVRTGSREIPVLRIGSRGKSGLHRAACRLTAGGVRSKRTLRKVPQKIYRLGGGDTIRVRVKWCGKSAPRPE